MLRTICLALLLLASGLLSQNALAKNFYKASIAVKLTHSSAFQKTQTLVSKRIEVVMSDDSHDYNPGSFCQLKIDGKIYDCVGKLYSKKAYDVTLNEGVLKQVLQSHFSLPASTILSINLTAGFTMTRSWGKYEGTNRTTKAQFHTDKNDESYHLIATARRAHIQ